MANPNRSKAAVLPATAYAEILYGCNLRCNYCYIGEDENHINRTIPPWQAWAAAFRTAYGLGVNEIIFLGGEPLMHPQLEDLLRESKEAGFTSRGVVTNGTTITPAKVAMIAHYGFWVDVTLRAASEDTWKAITGVPNSWHRLEVGLELLSSNNIPLAIEYDCTPENYQELYRTAEWLGNSRISVRHIQLHRILPMGDARDRYPENVLAAQQWNTVFEQARRIKEDFEIEILMEDGLPFCIVDPAHWHRLLSCSCGNNLVTIGPDFSLRRCACDPDSVGHLFDPPDVIRSALGLATTPKLPKPCLECPAADICRGGCSASRIGSNGHQPDHYLSFFAPIEMEVWKEFGSDIRARQITGQCAVNIHRATRAAG